MNRNWPFAVLLLALAAFAQAQYVEDSIDVGGALVYSLVHNPRANVVYGASETGILFAISCDSNKVVSSVPLSGPRILCYDSIDDKAYCCFTGGNGDSLAVIDGSTHQVVKKIEMPGATILVWDRVSNRLYVSCQSTWQVAVLDCATDSLLGYIPVGASPVKMHVNTLRRKLYVQNHTGGSVTIVDMTTSQVLNTVQVGRYVNTGFYCRRVDKYYCGGMSGKVSVIDGRGDSLRATIPLPAGSPALSMTGNEQRALVYIGSSNSMSDTVYTVAAGSDSRVAATAVGLAPECLLFSQASDRVYAACARPWSVQVLTSDGSELVSVLPVASYPHIMLEVERCSRIYVGHAGSRMVYVIRDSVTGVEERPTVPEVELPLAVSPSHSAAGFTVSYSLPRACAVDVSVLSVTGARVQTLATGLVQAGVHKVEWTPERSMPAGVYLVKLTADGFSATQKLVVQR